MPVLILNETDMRRCVSLNEVMDKVEDAYRMYATGAFHMPDRSAVNHGRDTLLYMPCFMDGCFGTKFLALFPDNPQKGLPYIDGLMLLNDAESGKTVAILDGSFLTALRTGAVGGVGMRCFSPEEAHSVGVIGAGKQGFYQALYATHARDIRHICFFDSMQKDLSGYLSELQKSMGDKRAKMHVCGSPEELLAQSEIVVTTTTSLQPVVPDDARLLSGHSFIGIGSYKPEMRELPDAIWQCVDVVWTEMPFALEESGDLSQPMAAGLIDKSRVRYIGDLLTASRHPAPPAKGETRYFKSVGMGLVDLNVAQLIYERAKEQGIGQDVDL